MDIAVANDRWNVVKWLHENIDDSDTEAYYTTELV
jgi:hypothetical protein